MFAPVHDIIIAAVLCRGNSVAWAAIFVIHSTYTSSHDEELSLPVRYLTRGQQWQFYIAKHGWPQPDGRPNEPSSPRGHRDSRGRNERLIYRHYRAHHAVRVRRYGGGGGDDCGIYGLFLSRASAPSLQVKVLCTHARYANNSVVAAFSMSPASWLLWTYGNNQSIWFTTTVASK